VYSPPFQAGSAPLAYHKAYPTPDEADRFVAEQTNSRVGSMDANDTLYAFAASRNYDPSAGLERITVPVMWINSADDFINPPELGVAERMAPRLKRGRFVLIPASTETHGHGTHTWAAIWKEYLEELLKESAR
jgi:homoserine O-acetyltransferase